MMNKKAIQRRIRSVKSTRKITKAMELVSAAKMRKATEAVIGSRPYVEMLREVVRKIAMTTDITKHPLLRRGQGRERILVVIMMSDRGLAGGYNVQMIRALRRFLEEHAVEVIVDAVTIGKRAGYAAKLLNLNIVGSYVDFSNKPSSEKLRPVVKTILEGYVDSTYDDVFIGYTDFKSAVSQVPVVAAFLPLVKMMEGLGEVGGRLMDDKSDKEAEELSMPPDFTFEPSKRAILDQALPRIIESMTYQALLEAVASEHASRMMAMKNASDAAGEMIDDLTLTFNQARQAAITQEIAEISGGAAALE
jgi:F-type H+-transporting ATPase subunit gamma